MIYVKDLFPSLVTIVKALSYIDDIALVVSITSLKKNIKILEKEVARLYKLRATNVIEFDLAKTKLLYFFTAKEAKSASLWLPNQEVNLKELVK